MGQCQSDEEPSPDTLLARIGGHTSLKAAVDLFYEKVIADQTLADFFEGVDMVKLKMHQRKFFSLALTKVPESVDVPALILEKHSKLFDIGLNTSHFDSVAGHLVKALEELEVPVNLIEEVVAVVSPLRAVFQKGTKERVLDRIGGDEALEATVDLFYEKVVADEKLAPFFEGIEMDKLRRHQVKFFKVALTKVPESVDVPKLILEKHSRLFKEKGLNETHFDLVAGHLVAALKELEVHPRNIDAVVAVVAPLRHVFERGATLYERLGGSSAVEAVVDEFYKRVLADWGLKKFFKGVKMGRLKQHQRNFFKIAFSKIPDSLDVADLILKKHQRLFANGLDETHFDKVAGHLVGAMQQLKVPKKLIDEAVEIVGPLRDVFVQGAAASKKK